MVDEPASVVRIPSADRGVAIGAAIAIGALILTVTGWLRDDIRSLAIDLKTLGGAVQTLSAGVETLQVDVKTLQVDVKSLDAKVDSIDKRLAVVESHVPGVPSVAQVEEGA